jgi:hypothetical protein
MKFNITYSYGGQKFDSIEDAVTKAIQDGIKESIEEKLRPFASELDRAGAVVNLTFNDTTGSSTVSISNVPDDIADAVGRALNS